MSGKCAFSYLDDFDFDLPKRKTSSMQLTSCNIIAGLAVLAIIYTLIFSPQENYHYRQRMHQVSSAFSNISAMIVNHSEGTPSNKLKPASQNAHVAPKISDLGTQNLCMVADAKNADTDAMAYSSMTEDEKMELSNLITEYLNENEAVVVMFFAEWCGHCSNAMHPVNEASQMQPDVPFLMVNADAVPRSYLSKNTGGIVDLPHFPFIVRFEQGKPMKIFDSPMSAKNLNDEVGYLPESKQVTDKALQMLF